MVGQEAPRLPPRPLFGGAITCTIPSQFDDISQIRPIPDNQEVFAHAATDRSLIIELLESTPTSQHRATQHFNQLASDSHANSTTILHTLTPTPSSYSLLYSSDPTFTISLVHGTQVVSKFRDDPSKANIVNISLACITLTRASTDLLVIFNDPIILNPTGNSARIGATVANPQQADISTRAKVFTDALTSLRILDWGLFV